jgi:dinuclear metal center YbgI/SA1388 family protein
MRLCAANRDSCAGSRIRFPFSWKPASGSDSDVFLEEGHAMALTLAQVSRIVDELAPFRLAYDWDNVGLQVGDPGAPVTNLMLMLELDEAGLAAARGTRCQAVLTHHPLIFQPMKSLRADDPAGALVMQLVRSGMGLIAAHTNLDRVRHGTNGALAEIIGLRDAKPLETHSLNASRKFVVFVPADYTGKIIEAIHRGGGGRIGEYTRCSFRAGGTGTFVPSARAKPHIGETGNFEQVPEERIEAVVPRACVKSVLHEVLQAHPYEEVAYDIYPLEDGDSPYGLGLVGRLQPAETLGALARRVAAACRADVPMLTGNPADKVRKVAVVTGSPGPMLRGITPDVADAVVTGEVSYHLAAEAQQRGQRLILLGHAASEKVFASHFAQVLREVPAVRAAGVSIHVHEGFADPFEPVAPAVARRRRRSEI